MPASCWRGPGGGRSTAATGLRRRTCSNGVPACSREPDPRHVRTLLDLGRCLAESGDDLPGSRLALERAVAECDALERGDLRIRAQLELSIVRTYTEAETRTDERAALALEAIGVLERDEDDEGLARAWFVLATTHWTESRWDHMLEPLDHSIRHARRAGNRSMELEALTFLLAAVMFGSTPVEEGIQRGRDVLASIHDSRDLQGWALRIVGTLLALEGSVDEGRDLLEQARTIFTEHGNKLALAVLAFSTGPLELRAGDPVAAEREFRAALDAVQQIGDRGRVPNLAAMLADALLEQGRIDEAGHFVQVARDGAQTGDVSGQAFWRMAAARLLARQGDTDEAVRLAHESTSMMAETGELMRRPELLVREAEVLELAGREADAAAALREAIELWELKGAAAEVRRTQERLAAVEAG